MADRPAPEGRRIATAQSASPHEPRPARSYDTAQLFGPDAEVEITHQGAVYRLKITRQGKLILNK